MTKNPTSKEALFTDALALPPAERGVFLAKACGADVELLSKLSALIAAHEGPDSLISPALLATVATVPDNRPRAERGGLLLAMMLLAGCATPPGTHDEVQPLPSRLHADEGSIPTR